MSLILYCSVDKLGFQVIMTPSHIGVKLNLLPTQMEAFYSPSL